MRKGAILAAFAYVLAPMVLLNIGGNLREAGRPDWTAPLAARLPALDGLMLRQCWSLFSYIPPFNFITKFEAILHDGRTVLLDDGAWQSATGWPSLLYYNELKIHNNLYGHPIYLRRYAEYLLRKHQIAPAQVQRRVIFIDYRMLATREEAAATGSLYGTSGRMELDAY